MPMHVSLVNTNRIKPPIAPIGLDYIAEAVNASGHYVEILDLCWEENWDSAITSFFSKSNFDIVGVTLRNIDDGAFVSSQSFLSDFTDMVKAIRQHTEALIVLGGVGFSIMPEKILEACNADAGVWADGEIIIAEIANRIDAKREWRDLPNLILCHNGGWYRNPLSFPPLANLPSMSRRWIDNQRYFREGGQIGIETKRGCSGHCIYCADPIAKGKKIRTRSPKSVVDEMERLLELGINYIHICDSEFNLPEWHSIAVCREIISRNLADKLNWYAYCSPVTFPKELAKLMRRAGCVGINFGVDNGNEEMLKILKRNFVPNDIVNIVQSCKEAGILVMFDLLLGSPGETKESLISTIELIKQTKPDRVGVSLGLRVYPGTELENLVKKKEKIEGLVGGGDISSPIFFLEPKIESFVFQLLNDLVGDDERFFFFDPSRPDRNYNYNANQLLVEAIQKGYRGAYWDILRRYR